MNRMKILYSSAFAFALGAFAFQAFADDKIDAEDFVDEASAKGIAEIETSKLALEKSSSEAVRRFAQSMIDDHTAANQQLAQIARQKNLEVADDAELMSKAKKLILKLRDGESFDVAYAKNQVAAHEKTIELFQKASRSKHPEIKAFADKTLPKLQGHLQMARQLVNTTEAAERNDSSRKGLSSSAYSTTSSAGPDRASDRGVGSVPATTYSD